MDLSSRVRRNFLFGFLVVLVVASFASAQTGTTRTTKKPKRKFRLTREDKSIHCSFFSLIVFLRITRLGEARAYARDTNAERASHSSAEKNIRQPLPHPTQSRAIQL